MGQVCFVQEENGQRKQSQRAVLRDHFALNTTNSRFSALLTRYAHWIRTAVDKNTESLSGLIYDFYGGSSFNDAVAHVLSDYQHIITNLDDDRVYIDRHGRCTVAECGCLRRAHRDTTALSETNVQRQSLYFGVREEMDIVLLQHLDIAHSLWYHTLDQGLRLHEDTQSMDLKGKRRSLGRHRAAFDRTCGGQRAKLSKFVTHFTGNGDDDNENEERMCEYSEGIRFYYHSRYKNIHTQSEKVPGTGNCIDVSFWVEISLVIYRPLLVHK